MSLLDLAILYTLLGLACAVAIYRSAAFAPGAGSGSASSAGRAAPDRAAHLRALGSAALALPLWPLWAPIALGHRPARPAAHPSPRIAPAAAAARSPQARPASPSDAADLSPTSSPAADIAARIEAALAECVDACAGTPIASLLPAEAAARISAEVTRAAARHAELTALLHRPDLQIPHARRRLAAIEAEQAERPSSRAVATARLHIDNVRRLAALRDRDARALEELEDLVQALRAQLLLARYAGAPLATPPAANAANAGAGATLEGTSGIVAEVWARVEGLSAVLESHDALDPEPPPAPAPSTATAQERENQNPP